MSWPVQPLSQVCDVIMGQSPSGKDCNQDEQGHPLVGGASDFSTKYPSPKKWTTSPTKLSSEGDILYCIRATIGKKNWADKEYCLGRGVAALRPKPKILNPNYLWHFLDTSLPHLLQQAKGSTFLQVTGPQVRGIEVPLPPLSEQKRIAEILDCADAIRRTRQETLKTCDELLRSTFLEMFGDIRKTECTWPRTTLGETTIIDAPMVDPQSEQYLNLLHIGPDRIVKETGEILPALTAKEEKLISGKYLFDERHVLYSKIRPYLRKVALPEFTGLCSADIYPLRPVVDRMTKEFLQSLLLSQSFLIYTESLPSRSSIPKLNRKELAKYAFNLPPLELQYKFSEIVKKYIQLKTACNDLLETESTLFNSLVQRAFRGEL